MDPEKRQAIKSEMGPYRQTAQAGCGYAFVAAIILVVTGHWFWLFVLCVVVLVGITLAGAKIGRTGPADDSQRKFYESALMMSGIPELGESTLPRATLGLIAWGPGFISLLGGHRQFLKAARAGVAGQEWLLAQLESQDPFDRWRAVVTLGRVGDDSVVSGLARYQEDPDPRVREAVATALGSLATDEAVEDLERVAATTPDDVEWLAAVSRLCEHGRLPQIERARIVRAANLIRTEQTFDRDRLAPLLAPLPIDLVEDELRAALADTVGGQLRALKFLASNPDPKAVAIVKQALASPDARTVQSALLGLPRQTPAEYQDDVRRIAESGVGRPKRMALGRLKRMEEEATTP